jgi:hypothetical protein
VYLEYGKVKLGNSYWKGEELRTSNVEARDADYLNILC